MSGDIIEIVFRVKEHHRVVTFSQVLYALRLHVALILAGDMIGHKVDDDFQPCLVGAGDKRLKFRHASFHVLGEIRAHVIIVANRIGRPCDTFYNMRIAWLDALAGIVSCCGVFNDAGIPHMSRAQ